MSLAQSQANSATAYAVNILDDEVSFLINYYYADVYRTKAATSAFHQGAIFYGPFTLWDLRETLTGAAPGGRSTLDVTKYSDGLLGIGLVVEAPMIVDPNTTGTLQSVTTTATQYFAQASVDVAVPTLTYTAAAGGIDGIAKLSMRPSQTGHLMTTGSTNLTLAAGSLVVITFTAGGTIVLAVNGTGTGGAAAGTGAAVSGRLVSYSGTVSGSLAGTGVLSSADSVSVAGVNGDENTSNSALIPLTLASCFIAFDAAWTVTTAGARIAQGTTPALSNSTGFFTTAANSTALAISNVGTLTSTIESGVNVHNAYYVNGMPCSAIAGFRLQQGGATIYDNISGAALRRMEMGLRAKDTWNQGAISNFGTQATLARWAHRTPVSASGNATQLFAYYLPIFGTSTSEAIWLNSQKGGTASLTFTLTQLNQLCTRSDVSLTATVGDLPNKRNSDHSDSGVQITNADLHYSVQLLYYTMTSSERGFFTKLNTVRLMTTLSVTQSDAHAQGATVVQTNYNLNKIATLHQCSGQAEHSHRPITNGKFDQHTYLRNLDGSKGPTAASSTVQHIPMIASVDEFFQGGKRATLDAVTVGSYSNFLRAGPVANDTGVYYLPYDIISHMPGKEGHMAGVNPNSSIDKHSFTARLHPNSPPGVVNHEHVGRIFVAISKNTFQQVFT